MLMKYATSLQIKIALEYFVYCLLVFTVHHIVNPARSGRHLSTSKSPGRYSVHAPSCLTPCPRQIDSEIIYHKVIMEICERYGKKYNDNLQAQMYGLTDRQLSAELVRELKLPMDADDFSRQLANSVKKLLPSAPLKEGAERLLRHLYNFKIPFALVTNSTADSVRTHADAWPKLFGMFHHKVCITDLGVWRGKPHPEIYLTASSRFCPKPSPTQCLVFEDSEVGVEAALRAGMQVVMIPDRRLKNLSRKATLVLQSLLDFKPELFGLPPFYVSA